MRDTVALSGVIISAAVCVICILMCLIYIFSNNAPILPNAEHDIAITHYGSNTDYISINPDLPRFRNPELSDLTGAYGRTISNLTQNYSYYEIVPLLDDGTVIGYYIIGVSK